MRKERPPGGFAIQREFAFSRGDFRRVQKLIRALAGIALLEHKENMVYNRLARRLRETGIGTFREYLDLVETAGPPRSGGPFVNALTTNLTSFFREGHHFEMLASFAGARQREALGQPSASGAAPARRAKSPIPRRSCCAKRPARAKSSPPTSIPTY